MPTLFRFLMVLGVIAGVVAGSLYVLAEYFQPEPKEISKALRNVKARIAGGDGCHPSARHHGTPGAAPAPATQPAAPPVPGAAPAAAPVGTANQNQGRAQ